LSSTYGSVTGFALKIEKTGDGEESGWTKVEEAQPPEEQRRQGNFGMHPFAPGPDLAQLRLGNGAMARAPVTAGQLVVFGDSLRS
jgi:hypothetical protein